MKKKDYRLVVASVFDSATKVYFQPFYARSRAEAIRSFAECANQEGHPFCKHPGDFTLFIIAEWDEDTGKFENLVAPDCLGTALEHKVQVKSDNLELFPDADTA